jgi:hypothetical protein
MLDAGLIMGVKDENTGQVQSVNVEGPTDGDPDFIHWTFPSPYTRKWSMTAEEHLAAIAKRRAMTANVYLPDKTRADAEKQLVSLLDGSDKRGLTVPDGLDPRAMAPAAA